METPTYSGGDADEDLTGYPGGEIHGNIVN